MGTLDGGLPNPTVPPPPIFKDALVSHASSTLHTSPSILLDLINTPPDSPKLGKLQYITIASSFLDILILIIRR